MFIKKRDYDNAIVKVRINIGKILGCETDEEAFVVIRELSTASMMDLRDAAAKGGKTLVETYERILPDAIVEHNLYEDEQTLMSTAEIAHMICDKLELFAKVSEEYSKKAFFIQGGKKSAS